MFFVQVAITGPSSLFDCKHIPEDICKNVCALKKK